jgi:PiT family inorganic phosphate transporter
MGDHSLNRDPDSLINSNTFENPLRNKEMNMDEKTRNLVFKTFRILMLIAATMVCLGHGANDVANSISPLVIVLEANGIDGKFPYAVGSAGIALGLLILGKKVMETVGKKVVQLDFAKGYCA